MAKEEKEKKKNKRPTAQKRQLQNAKNCLQNRMFRSQIRTAIRRFRETAAQGDAEKSQQCLKEVYSLTDKAVKRGIFKLNKASRVKAILTAQM